MATAAVGTGPRRKLQVDVFTAAVSRLTDLYRAGHRLVVSVSGGKDSGICLELAVIAATQAGCLPVEAITRDEEILYPGSFDYLDRLAARTDVRLMRVLRHRPIVNIFNRFDPYYWPFDDRLDRAAWFRQPPPGAVDLGSETLATGQVTPERFPPQPGKDLMVVLGLRASESRGRMYGLFSAGSYLTKANEHGVRSCRPIYDWADGDVWLAYKRFGWDYNRAYDDLSRLGVPRHKLRVAPPALNAAAADILPIAARAWPAWFARVCERLPGFRQGGMFGRTAVTPKRRSDETWEDCFKRECLGPDLPDWIRDRAQRWADKMNSHHRSHAPTVPFPQVAPCHHCDGNQGSWRTLALAMWNGDPTSVHARGLPEVQPEFFRPGAGTWRHATQRW